MSGARSIRADVDEAYNIQVKAATKGGVIGAGVGLGLVTLGHFYWPSFRRRTTPAFKGFMVSIFTVFGLVLTADNALLSHEAERRLAENAIRKEARIDLARRGLVATESEIAKWKAEKEKKMQS